MKFDNHPPINFENADQVARAARDGGAYSEIGFDRYTVFQGKSIHLVHYYSSGCEYNNRVDRSRTHIGNWATLPEFLGWLKSQPTTWWSNELMSDLNYDGEDA